MTRRVLHIAKANGIGGSERHLLTLLPGLVARGVDVTIIVLEEGPSRRFVEPLRALGIKVLTRPAGPNENPRLVPALAHRIRTVAPDLVHTHLLHADLYGLPAARLCGVPAVRSIHRTVGRRGYRSLERLVGPLASRTIAISSDVEQFIAQARLAAPDRVRVIPYGIDVESFGRAAEHRDIAREELGLEPDDVAVGVASRLVPGKGHDVLIGAIALAHATAPSIRLQIAGDGPLRRDLESRAARHLPAGVARFAGHVVDVGRFMSACDVLVFPSLPAFGEGFGLAALEAIACGCPVVATPVGSMPDMVVDGVTGLLVAPGDVQSLAHALTRLASDADLRRLLGSQGADLARRSFEADAMIDATLAVYEDLLAGMGGRHVGHPRVRLPQMGA